MLQGILPISKITGKFSVQLRTHMVLESVIFATSIRFQFVIIDKKTTASETPAVGPIALTHNTKQIRGVRDKPDVS